MTTRGMKFKDVCSAKCLSLSRTKTNPLLEDRSWLYEQRIIKERAYEDISEELDIPVASLKKHLAKFNIPKRNFNGDRNFDVQEILADKETLVKLYETNSATSIADKLDVSTDLVLKWLGRHDIEMKPGNYWPRKFVKISEPEQEIADFIKSIYDGTVIQGNRSILGGREIDIYLPELNLGFEYNGLYYHCEKWHGSLYHHKKIVDAAAKGVTIYNIWSDSYREKAEIWKSRIRYMLGACERTEYARKCHIKSIDRKEKDDFLNDNHLQGKDRSKFKYGLFLDDELLSVMTFSKCRFGKKYDHELVRYACAKNVNVVGGFSKLLKHFTRQHDGSIVSYADLSYSKGDVYEKNGFDLVKTYKSGYVYSKNWEVSHNRMNFTKVAMRKRFPNFNFTTNTEIKMAHELGYYRVYGCGMKTYVLAK